MLLSAILPFRQKFYLFYKSKELLLFEVIQEQQKNINLELYQAFSDIADMELSAEKLTDMIFEFYKKTEKGGNKNVRQYTASFTLPPIAGQDLNLRKAKRMAGKSLRGKSSAEKGILFPSAKAFWIFSHRNRNSSIPGANIRKRKAMTVSTGNLTPARQKINGKSNSSNPESQHRHGLYLWRET